jgi:ATP-binding cassette subfamily B protein
LNFQDFVSTSYPKFQGNIINDNSNLKNYISTVITLYSELLIVASLTFLVCIINLKVAFTIFSIFLIITLTYIFFFKTKIKSWGSKRNDLSQLINKSIIEIYNSIKDIKILNKEKFFLNRFRSLNNNFSTMQFKYETLIAVNKNFIELSIIIVLTITFLTFKFNYNIYNLIPLLSVYIIGFFRIYPSINRIINCVTMMKFYHTGIDYFYNQEISLKTFKTEKFNKSQKINFLYHIEFKKGDKVSVLGAIRGSWKICLLSLKHTRTLQYSILAALRCYETPAL